MSKSIVLFTIVLIQFISFSSFAGECVADLGGKASGPFLEVKSDREKYPAKLATVAVENAIGVGSVIQLAKAGTKRIDYSLLPENDLMNAFGGGRLAETQTTHQLPIKPLILASSNAADGIVSYPIATGRVGFDVKYNAQYKKIYRNRKLDNQVKLEAELSDPTTYVSLNEKGPLNLKVVKVEVQKAEPTQEFQPSQRFADPGIRYLLYKTTTIVTLEIMDHVIPGLKDNQLRLIIVQKSSLSPAQPISVSALFDKTIPVLDANGPREVFGSYLESDVISSVLEKAGIIHLRLLKGTGPKEI